MGDKEFGIDIDGKKYVLIEDYQDLLKLYVESQRQLAIIERALEIAFGGDPEPISFYREMAAAEIEKEGNNART